MGKVKDMDSKEERMAQIHDAIQDLQQACLI